MTKIQFAIYFAVLAQLSPALRAQMCYVTVATGQSCSQCQDPPIFTVVQMIEDPGCTYQACFPLNYNGEVGEQHHMYLRDEADIPLPQNYVQVKYYSDDECTTEVSYNTTEYYAIGNCTMWFTASCDETIARIQRYSSEGCDQAPVLDETYPLHQCTQTSSGYVRVSCTMSEDVPTATVPTVSL